MHTVVQSLDTNKNEYRKVKIKINKTYQSYEEKQPEKMEISELPMQQQQPQQQQQQHPLIPPQPQNPTPVLTTPLQIPIPAESPKMTVLSPTLQEPRVSMEPLKNIHLHYLNLYFRFHRDF